MKGELSISHVGHSRQPGCYVCIRVADSLSGQSFLEVRLDSASFTDALMGLSGTDCTFELHHVERVGMRYEHKTEVVFVPSDAFRDSAIIRQAVAIHEVDGWIGSDDDAKNHHRGTNHESTPAGHSAYRVGYRRWVPVEAAEARKDAMEGRR